MNDYPYLVFLFSLSGFSFIIFILLRILDFFSATAKQKMIVLKSGIILITILPIAYSLLRLFSWHVLLISLKEELINQLPTLLSIPLSESKINWSSYIFNIYKFSVSLMLFRILFSYLSARRKLIDSTPEIIQKQLVFINKHIKSPLSFGLPIAKIYFPSDMKERFSLREIELSLAHEKNHLKQNDSLWKLFSLFAQAILFFVPWVYYLHRRLELEMEIICDERTCIETNANINEYGNLLLAMTCIQSQNLIFTNITDSTLKRRFLAMKSKKIKRPLLTSLSCAILLLTGSATIAMSTGMIDKNFFKITTKIIIDGKLISSPQILAKENQEASIVLANNTQGLKMKLVANNNAKNNAIEINYDIEYKNDKDEMRANPHMIIMPNQEGTIRIASDSGHSYEMKVIAEKQ
jgi:hypothetical protein